tara:strand:+ start:4525 stop:4749 length:225 start_codon:yes stop_codon:yes gene_type:complete
MSYKLKVEGQSNLVRDSYNKAIINTNASEYQLYMARISQRKSQSDQIKGACREINNLKKELLEIKSLIKEVIKS